MHLSGSGLDSIVTLKEFSIEAPRHAQSHAGQKSEKLDSTNLQNLFAQNLANLLTQNNAMFIKSYGLGSLATASFRGSSAYQTATLWNGFNLQSPMNGILDYALVPSFLMDEVTLNYGGAGALFGSGAIGGTILLNNRSKFNAGLEVSLQAGFGSFDNYNQGLKISWSNDKIALAVRVFSQTALNNYPFINSAEPNKPLEYQQHAKLKQQGALLENYFQLTARQKLSLRFWYQNTARQIPSDLLSADSKSEQLDEFFRTCLEWNFSGKKNSTAIRAAFFDEDLIFNDANISLNSQSHSRSFIAEAENNFSLGSGFVLNAGVNATYLEANSKEYSKTKPSQNRESFFSALQHSSKNLKWKSKISLRKEFYGQQQAPFTASLGSERKLGALLSLRGNVSKNYRLPTFNDLFWKENLAEGNPNLKPESGWSGDVGIQENFAKNNFGVNSGLSVFISEVRDMIVWQPASLGIWMPHNISSVWSRGLETNLNLHYLFKIVLLDLKAKYSFTRSTENKLTANNAHSFGKQIFYVPTHLGSFEIGMTIKGFKVAYLHNYTGKRFITADNTHYLRPYEIGTFTFSKSIHLKKFAIAVFFRVDNCWNKNYQLLAWRPMPMRSYQSGITFNFQSKKST